MRSLPKPRTQKFTIIAQDPGVRDARKKIVRAQVEVPAELLQPGPWGYRVQVVDFDAGCDRLWKPRAYSFAKGEVVDPFVAATDEQLLADPQFHQQNVYAIVMRVLARFEHALGRRVSWSFGGHQLKVAPHATCDANAYYSKENEGLFFGYFVDPGFSGRTAKAGDGLIFTCLSHDVVAHETTHALVDGLRQRYTDPSSPDQAAFHEGISDVVALLSIFSLPEVMSSLLGANAQTKSVPASGLTPEKLRASALFAMAEEMGTSLAQVRGSALRRSAELSPDPKWLKTEEFQEPHRRGEILVAAMLNALIHIWSARVTGLRQVRGQMDVERVVEEGRRAADILLTMTIRALDYCPPVHLEFGDYLSALVTADREIRPDDSTFQFRTHLLASFAAYGIQPTSPYGDNEKGIWGSPQQEFGGKELTYDRSHFEPMQRDADEVFRFIWENRRVLGLKEGVFTQVQSVRPCVRVGDDGFILRETVAEYVQIHRLMPAELALEGYQRPDPTLLPDDREVFLYGGGALIFDEWGHLKYHVHNRIDNTAQQNKRLAHLAETGYFLSLRPRTETARLSGVGRFARMHLDRGLNVRSRAAEGWLGAAPPRPLTRSHVCGAVLGLSPSDSYADE
jgi:hypothetical protein